MAEDTGGATRKDDARPRHAVVLGALVVIVIAAKWPVLSTPYFWDEGIWIGFANRLVGGPLWRVLPGLHRPTEFGGRPFGLFLGMAVLFELFGSSIWLAHFYAAAFAAAGTYYTYRLGDLLYGPTAGVLAAAFLFSDSMYFAQSAMFLADLPTAALGAGCVYYALSGRYGRYFVCAICMLLVKETALALVCAVSVYFAALEVRASVGRAVRQAWRWAAPAAVIAVYYGAQKLTTGVLFINFGGEFPLFQSDSARAVGQAHQITRWLFVEQGRWIFVALIGAHLVLGRARRRRELLLFALIALLSGYSFSVLYFLPRYLLPVAPYLFVAAAGALVELVRQRTVRLALAAVILALAVDRRADGRRAGTREWSMGYLTVVRTFAKTCDYVENDLGAVRVATPWPLMRYLQEPALGYVRRPHDAVLPAWAVDADGIDVVIVHSLQGREDGARLERSARERGLEMVRRIEEDGVWCDVYLAPASRLCPAAAVSTSS